MTAAGPERAGTVEGNCVGTQRHSTTGHRLDTLLARLERVRSAGPNRWTACCPAHEDRSPSLSIRDAGDRILLHCFAGCFAEDVLAAIGLTFADLYPDDPSRAGREGFYGMRRPRTKIDPLDHARTVLVMAAERIKAGKPLSLEDEASIEVARERLRAARDG